MEVNTVVRSDGRRYVVINDIVNVLYRDLAALDERHEAAERGYIRTLIKRLENLEK